jgi:3-oxoacyl-[acyl-carrier-protein] synthase III
MIIASVAHSVPSQRTDNDEIVQMLIDANPDLSEESLTEIQSSLKKLWKQAGTEYRYLRGPQERAVEHALHACEVGLAEAHVAPQDVDFLIYVGVGRGWLEPSTGAYIQNAAGLNNATSFDILDACLSWLRGLQVAHSLIKSGVYKIGMIVNCEFNVREYGDLAIRSKDDLDHLFSTFTIGEAATATVVTNDNIQDDFYFTFKTYGSMYDACIIPLPNVDQYGDIKIQSASKPMRFYARHNSLMSFCLRKIDETFHTDGQFRADAYDVVFGHEASERAGAHLCRTLGIDINRYYHRHAEYGNTVSAAVPLGMSLAISEGRLRRGMKTLIGVGSAGVSIGLASFTF